jgi:hypothetical protein
MEVFNVDLASRRREQEMLAAKSLEGGTSK